MIWGDVAWYKKLLTKAELRAEYFQEYCSEQQRAKKKKEKKTRTGQEKEKTRTRKREPDKS